jgi:hypothetical protein
MLMYKAVRQLGVARYLGSCRGACDVQQHAACTQVPDTHLDRTRRGTCHAFGVAAVPRLVVVVPWF